jgi:hypothetical protein
MRNLIVAAIVTLFVANPAFAASCADQAVSKAGKPLAGAAKAASIKKCEKDAAASATAACEAKALSKDGKPLSGAAKNASVKKCVADAGK